ncbi:MAG TPA: glycosyltransferase family 1 protein [Miltoncostaeaceae bacterium]|nr:glycosyltransferase family 1 protein [Miltoncostaeaceae bacterium]
MLVDTTMTRKVRSGTTVYTQGLLAGAETIAPPDLELRPVSGPPLLPTGGWGARLANLLLHQAWLHAGLPLLALRHRAAAVWQPVNTASAWAPCPQVVTVHDLSFERYPELFPGPFLRYVRATVRLTARRARLILADSEATADDLVELMRVPRDRIRVVYPGVPPVPEDERPREPLVLTVGELGRRKRIAEVIQAFGTYRATAGAGGDWRLAVVGASGPDEEEIRALAARTDGVDFLGWVDDARLDDLYRRASLVVYASAYEGFGLPVVEAMLRGTPVLAARNSSLPEAGGPLCHYVDDVAPEPFARVLADLLSDPAALVAGGAGRRAYALRFRPERSSAALMAALREAVGAPASG